MTGIAAAVVPEPIVVYVPENCVECGVTGAVTLEHTVKGKLIMLDWCCRACSYAWPVRRSDAFRLRPKRDRRESPRPLQEQRSDQRDC